MEPGRIAGRYLPVEELGRGGMGVVLRGYDPILHREVALKLVHPSGFDVSTRKRMVREARAMAKLSHPNVVAVFDIDFAAEGVEVVGAVPNSVLIVMEYVPGPTLRTWLRGERRDWRSILDAFTEAGRGLAAAHAEGILHRDFKPANVLVGPDGRCRVTDFGLARETAESESEPEPVGWESDHRSGTKDLTEAGTVIGTLRYMAPEQHFGQPLDAAADQYAFCIALWEALTGTYPFTGIVAAGKKKGPPAWPKGTGVPSKVVGAIERGMSPAPHQRWNSMGDLLAALSHDPAVLRRRVIGGMTVVAAVGVVGVSGSFASGVEKRCSGGEAELADTWDIAIAEDVERAMNDTGLTYAPELWTRLRPRLDAYSQQWVDRYTAACEASTIRGERSSEDMELQMSCLREAKTGLQAVVRVLRDPDRTMLDKVYDVVDGLPPLERCDDVAALATSTPPPLAKEAEGVDEVQGLLADSRALRRAGKYEDAWSSAERAHARLQGLRYAPIRTRVLLEIGHAATARGQYEDAGTALRDAQRMALQSGQLELAFEAALSLTSLVGRTQARPAEGLAFGKIARGLVARKRDPARDSRLRRTVGGVFRLRGDYRPAERELRAALALSVDDTGAESSSTASVRTDLGGVLLDRGNFSEAEEQARLALAVWQGSLGPGHPTIANQRSRIAIILKAQGKLDEAESEQRRALGLLRTALGEEHPDVAYAHANLAGVLYALQRFTEAEEEYRGALGVLQRVHGPDHPNVAAMHGNLGAMLDAQGKHEAAAVELRAALRGYLKSHGDDHVDPAGVRINLALVLVKVGDDDAAEAEYRAAMAVLERAVGPGHPSRVLARASLGVFLAKRRRYAEARKLLESAWRTKREQGPGLTRARVAAALAQVLWVTQGEHERSRRLAEQARDFFERHRDRAPDELEAVEELLGNLPR